VSSLLAPCLSQFAVAVADDALWKQLNYQVLLKARHNLPQVSEMENVILFHHQEPFDKTFCTRVLSVASLHHHI
jgi:U3 small nucleolar RNA-associated protein 10